MGQAFLVVWRPDCAQSLTRPPGWLGSIMRVCTGCGTDRELPARGNDGEGPVMALEWLGNGARAWAVIWLVRWPNNM